MNLKEKKNIMSAIIDQLEQEHGTKGVPEREVFKIGYEDAGINDMRELVTEMLAIGFIYRPALGKFARKRANRNAKTIKVVVTVERDGEEIRRVRYDEWLDTLTIEEIVEEISDAIGSIDEV